MRDKDLLTFVEKFKKYLVDYGCYGTFSSLTDYEEYRKILLNCKYTDYIPTFLKNCKTRYELRDYLNTKLLYADDIKALYVKEFNTLIDKLESKIYKKNSNLNTVKKKFTSTYIKQSIDTMFDTMKKNPTEAIGKAKDLVENCNKTILDKFQIEYKNDENTSSLTKKVLKGLDLLPKDINDKSLNETLKQILNGGLCSIVNGLSSLRNSYGSGHGKGDDFKGLEPHYSKLAVECACSYTMFIWTCYKKYEKFNKK